MYNCRGIIDCAACKITKKEHDNIFFFFSILVNYINSDVNYNIYILITILYHLE